MVLVASLCAVLSADALGGDPSPPSLLAWLSRHVVVAEGNPWSIVALVAVITFCTLVVSEDLTCICCGLLAAQGDLWVGLGIPACIFGIWLGDVMLYGLGRAGHPLLKRAPFRWWISDGAVRRAEEWFAVRGPTVILLGRFVPGSRIPVFVAAGVLRLAPVRFMMTAALACFLWVPLLFGLAMALGHVVLGWLSHLRWLAGWGLVVGLVVLWGLIRIGSRLTTDAGRRRLRAWWLRFRRRALRGL